MASTPKRVSEKFMNESSVYETVNGKYIYDFFKVHLVKTIFPYAFENNGGLHVLRIHLW